MERRKFVIFWMCKLKVRRLFFQVVLPKRNRRDLVRAHQDKIEKHRPKLHKQDVKINKNYNNKYSIKIC